MGDMPGVGIRGAAVCLRALGRDDLETLRGFVNDPEVMRFSNVYRPISDVEQAAWFERTARDASCVWFGIDDVRGGAAKLIGTCCLVELDWVSRKAELRVRIGDRSAWGQGLGTEACARLVEFGFDHLNLERIWLRVLDSNPRAIRVYEKLGFVVEGTLRRSAYVDRAQRDTIVMGLLRSEWRARPAAGTQSGRARAGGKARRERAGRKAPARGKTS
jgi:RimJ/RimL family protein N-acetyltransferase